jgi:hypothetical protein
MTRALGLTPKAHLGMTTLSPTIAPEIVLQSSTAGRIFEGWRASRSFRFCLGDFPENVRGRVLAILGAFGAAMQTI